jgi:hypothetical protein
MNPRRPNSMAEGFTVAAIYAAIATPIVLAASIWQAGSWSNFYSQANLAGFLGDVVGNAILFGLCLAGVVALRNAADVKNQFLLDWRFWVVLVLMTALPQKPVLGWFWVSLIYSYRDQKRRPAPMPRVDVP